MQYENLIGKYALWVKLQINEIRNGGAMVFLQKLKTFFLRYLFLLPSLIAIIVIRLLSPIICIRFGNLASGRIGHFAAETELYLCERDAGLHPKNILDMFFYGDKYYFCNQQLKKMWERTRLLRIWDFSRYLYNINKLLPGYKRHIIETSVRDIYNLYERIPPHLSFTREEEMKGYEKLYEMGISNGSKFICFHSRDSTYLNTMLPRDNWSYHNHRDSDINNFLPAAEELVKRGYYMIRMGAKVKDSLTTNNTYIIDYATKFRTDFLDIFLSAKCFFFLGGFCGLDLVPLIFRRPVALTNVVPLECVQTWKPNELFIPKKYWFIKEQRFMTIREIFELGAERFYRTEQYDQIGIEIVENTQEEITALAIEMDKRLKGDWQTTEEDKELQQQFWSLYKPRDGLHGVIKSRIGADFLRQNQYLLK